MDENLTVTKGMDLEIGDDLEFLGHAYRITSFSDYDPTRVGLPAEAGWRIAHSIKGWGMTIDPNATFRVYATTATRQSPEGEKS